MKFENTTIFPFWGAGLLPHHQLSSCAYTIRLLRELRDFSSSLQKLFCNFRPSLLVWFIPIYGRSMHHLLKEKTDECRKHVSSNSVSGKQTFQMFKLIVFVIHMFPTTTQLFCIPQHCNLFKDVFCWIPTTTRHLRHYSTWWYCVPFKNYGTQSFSLYSSSVITVNKFVTLVSIIIFNDTLMAWKLQK
jgi:hypothetical protein